MRIERVYPYQGHPVPSKAYRPYGPFSAEVLQRPQVTVEYTPEPDGGGASIPTGGTAQNGYQSPEHN